MIGLGVREAKYELGCSQGRISAAMRELDDAGLARPTKIGAWRGRRATEWRLMFLRCDKTQEPAVTVWEQRKPHSEFTLGYAEVHAGVHREPLSSRGGTQKPNSSMNDQGLSSRGDTHVDIYQGEGNAAELTPEGVTLAESLSKNESNQRATSNVGLSANPKKPHETEEAMSVVYFPVARRINGLVCVVSRRGRHGLSPCQTVTIGASASGRRGT